MSEQPRSEAYTRFIASMRIGYAEWHDGAPYDVGAIDLMSAAERREVERRLVARKNKDWRDSEALARLGTDAAMAALLASTRGPNREVRLRAGKLLRENGRAVDLEGLIVEALRHGDGSDSALELATRYPSEAVERTLLHGLRCGEDNRTGFFASALLFIHGQLDDPEGYAAQFVNEPFIGPGPQRDAAFRVLCARIGVDPSSVSCAEPFPSVRSRLSFVLPRLAALLVLIGSVAWGLWQSLGPWLRVVHH